LLKKSFCSKVTICGQIRPYSVSCGLSAAPAPTGPDRTGSAQDRHRPARVVYVVFDTHFVLNSPKRYDILKILIKNVIKQPGPVVAGLVPIQSGQGRSVPMPVGADAGAADRPRETLYMSFV
jgi:hypothetical protein